MLQIRLLNPIEIGLQRRLRRELQVEPLILCLVQPAPAGTPPYKRKSEPAAAGEGRPAGRPRREEGDQQPSGRTRRRRSAAVGAGQGR